MSNLTRKYAVVLSANSRQCLEAIVRNGRAPAKKIQHARILLMSDSNHPAGRYHDKEIAKVLGLHVNTVARIRTRFVLEGEGPALERKKRMTPPVRPKLDGQAEAKLVALCCSDPPDGRMRWTLRLLQKEMVGRNIVTSICCETIRKTLKKTSCSLGDSSGSASPNATQPGSLRKWNKSLTSMPNRSTKTNR